ncbi:MAG TPA: patatin-like phospholipase family protein [Gemmataceae bacterium]|nr:patatin-like phospholipase family protein [Gemmataceae bacterium]
MEPAHLKWLCLAAVLLTGCTADRPYPPLSLPTARLLELNDAAGSRLAQARSDQGVQAGPSRPRNVLVLAGGGANGAYAAGVLKGWSSKGTRPPFDVVTGISSGALIAPFAFLGPEYDESLARESVELRASDVYHERLLTALLWSDSLADSSPLQRRLAAEITPELVAKVAQAHAEGRRLFVGTTNLDTKRLVIWDLGAIAAGNEPDKLELFRQVLLAAASVPGALSPVPINLQVNGQWYTELHVDGGVNASLFLQPAMLGVEQDRENPGTAVDTRVYVIVARKLQPPAHPVERRLFPVARESVAAVLQSRFEGDLLKVYRLTSSAGAQFALTAIPDESPEEPDRMSVTPNIMRELFDRGYRAGAEGIDWRTSPPGLASEEHLPPRGGVIFTTEQGSAK